MEDQDTSRSKYLDFVVSDNATFEESQDDHWSRSIANEADMRLNSFHQWKRVGWPIKVLVIICVLVVLLKLSFIVF